jgi:hypothetical protein
MGLKNTYQTRKKFTKTPVKSTGMWYQDGDVVVPSNQITMKGPQGQPNYFNSPILGVGMQSGETKVMQPGREYLFPNDKSVFETKMQNGGGVELALDAASFVPGYVGMGASTLGMGLNLYQGDYTGAALDAANVVTGGLAKGFKTASQAARMGGSGRLAKSMADKAKFLEKASNPNIYKTTGLIRDYQFTTPTEFGGYSDNTRLAPPVRPEQFWYTPEMWDNAINKAKKNKQMQNGGELPEDYEQFKKFQETLPNNLKDSNYKYNDPNSYDLYGMWDASNKPNSFSDVKDSDLFPLQDDGTYHGFSVSPKTGEFLKPKNHPSTWMEVYQAQFNPDLQNQAIIQNEKGRLQYVPRTMQGGGEQLSNFERLQDVYIKAKRRKKSDNPNYFWKNNDLFYKPVSPDAPNLPPTKVNKLNPTLGDLVSTVGSDAPIDTTYKNPNNKVVLPPSKYMDNLISEYIKPQVINKTFGQIEDNQGHFLDEGYSKRRAWVNTPYAPTENAMNNLANENLNSYFLIPNKSIPGYDIDYSKGETLDLINQQYDTIGHSPVPDEPNADKYNYGENNWFSPVNSWNRSRQLAVEMQNNPEIVAWAREHNIDLSSKPRVSEKGKDLQTGEFFAPKVAEQILAKKGADQGDAIVTAPLRNYAYTRVIQDPSAFNLVGYADNNTVRAFMEKYKKEKGITSITPEMEVDFKKSLLKELNIDADPNKVFTHFNRSPLNEYTPGMQMGGMSIPGVNGTVVANTLQQSYNNKKKPKWRK